LKQVVGGAILLEDHDYVLNERGVGREAFGTSTAAI